MGLVARGSPQVTAVGPAEWRPAFERWHSGLVITALITACLIPGPPSATVGGASLLVGGALLGVPHGASDFLVAHELFESRLGALWLPVFVTAYLGLGLCVLAGWTLAPVTTLIGFVLVSCVHFGHEGCCERPQHMISLGFAARATTPLVPVLFLHPGDVGPIVAMLASVSEADAIHWLEVLRPAMLCAWAGFTTVAIAHQLALQPIRSSRLETAELGALGTASVLAAPLTVFMIYFCLLHAIRHMGQLMSRLHPLRPSEALRSASLIVGPAAVICCVVLGLCWAGAAGAMPTTSVIAGALRILAALTVPHMILELMSHYGESLTLPVSAALSPAESRHRGETDPDQNGAAHRRMG